MNANKFYKNQQKIDAFIRYGTKGLKIWIPVFVQASDKANPPPMKSKTPQGSLLSMISQDTRAGDDSGLSLADLKLVYTSVI